jgi:O-antigen ligase
MSLKKILSSPAILTIPLLWLGFGAALFYTGTDSIWFAPSLVCILLAGILFLLPGLKSGWAVPRTPVVLIICLNWLYLLIALHWSTAPFISAIFFAVFSIQPFLFLTLIMGDEKGENTLAHGMAMLAALAAVALWAVIQYLFFYRQFGPRIHHPLFDPNNMAAVMNMGLLPSVALFMTARDRIKIFLWLGLVALFFAALISTQSRGGLLCGGAAMLLMLPFVILPLRRQWSKCASLLALFILVPAFMHVYGLFLHGDSGLAVNFLSTGMASVTDRVALWRSTWKMIADHVWMGPGLGTFYYYYSFYRLPVDHSDGYFAHMDALQLWAETGIAAFVLFYAGVLALAWRTLHAIHIAPPEKARERALVAATFAGLLAVILHSHLNFSLYLPGLCVPMAILLACWYAGTEKIIQDRRFLPGTGRAGIAAFAVVVILSAGVSQWIVRSATGTYYIGKTAEAEARGDVAAMRAAIGTTARLAPADLFFVPQYEARWRALMLKQPNNFSTDEKKAMIDEGLRQTDRALALNTGFAYIRVTRADFYGMAQENGFMPDGDDRAIVELEKVLKADPLSLEARYALSYIYQRRGELKEALNVLGEGLNWPRPKGQPEIDFMVSVALLCRETGDQECYRRLIEAARNIAIGYGLTSGGK